MQRRRVLCATALQEYIVEAVREDDQVTGSARESAKDSGPLAALLEVAPLV